LVPEDDLSGLRDRIPLYVLWYVGGGTPVPEGGAEFRPLVTEFSRVTGNSVTQPPHQGVVPEPLMRDNEVVYFP
jgi:hypothetical protein